MKNIGLFILLSFVSIMLFSPPASAAPFDPSSLKISVDDSLWQNYHVGPDQVSGDIVKLYRIKKAEVAILTGNREFAVHSFTPKESKPHRFTLPHGLPNLKVRLKTWTADDLVWTTLVELKDRDDSLVVKALPTSLATYTPGF